MPNQYNRAPKHAEHSEVVYDRFAEIGVALDILSTVLRTVQEVADAVVMEVAEVYEPSPSADIIQFPGQLTDAGAYSYDAPQLQPSQSLVESPESEAYQAIAEAYGDTSPEVVQPVPVTPDFTKTASYEQPDAELFAFPTEQPSAAETFRQAPVDTNVVPFPEAYPDPFANGGFDEKSA